MLHVRGIYYSCIVQLGNNVGTMCFGPLRNCFHTHLLVSWLLLHWGSRLQVGRIDVKAAATPGRYMRPLVQCRRGLAETSLVACRGPKSRLHLQAAVQRCVGLQLLDLLTHNSWKVDGPCPLKTHETIITHFCKQLPKLKVGPIGPQRSVEAPQSSVGRSSGV